MFKKFGLLLACICTICGARSQQIQASLDSSAYAAVITCGAGDDFYTTFGHSAIRICDSVLGLDLVYNYGTFDFDQPHFYWTFVCGNLDYCLSRTSYSNFLSEYVFEGREVVQQRLRLSNQELNNLFVLLETNYLPMYRYYRYDFFSDNCATRVRDIVSSSLSHRTLFVESDVENGMSYRQLLTAATGAPLAWWQFGIDLLLGVRCDHRCSNMEYMFSPVELMTQLDTTCMQEAGIPLADAPELLLSNQRTPQGRCMSPTLCFWLLFGVVFLLTIMERAKQWRMRWLDITLFVIVSLLSVALLFMWLGTSHYCTKWNLNILWASPLFIYFAIRLQKSKGWVVFCQLALLLVSVVMAIVGFPQQLNMSVIPISLMLAVRLVSGLLYNKDMRQR
ncbi:MAG: DUF4105 domain-containing protein, partial [Bacteroidales bacterium]|nr:DUF4105 domain-containing protein [Candidatus Colimorpha onthohippi]